MPCQWYNPSVMSNNPVVIRLTEAMTKYLFLIETCSQCVRPLPNKPQLYAEAVEEWKTRREFYQPGRDDEMAKEAFLAAVDTVCGIQSRTPKECYLIIFACSAGLQFATEYDYLSLTSGERLQIMTDSQRISRQRINEYMASTQAADSVGSGTTHPETRPGSTVEPHTLPLDARNRDPDLSGGAAIIL